MTTVTDPKMQTTAKALVVDVKEAQRMLGLGRSSILALADQGFLTPIRFGRSVRYSTEEISNLVEQRREAAARSANIYRLTPGDPAA